MCKVCIVTKGGEFGLKVSGGNGVMAGACFQSKVVSVVFAISDLQR